MENQLISKGATYLLSISDYIGVCNMCKKPNALHRPTLVLVLGRKTEEEIVAVPLEMLFCPHCEGYVREIYLKMREPENQTSTKEED